MTPFADLLVTLKWGLGSLSQSRSTTISESISRYISRILPYECRFSHDSGSAVDLLKLHGSLNWEDVGITKKSHTAGHARLSKDENSSRRAA